MPIRLAEPLVATLMAAHQSVVTIPLHETMIPPWDDLTIDLPGVETVQLSEVQRYWSGLERFDKGTYADTLGDDARRLEATTQIDDLYDEIDKCLEQQSLAAKYTQTEYENVMATVGDCIDSHAKIPQFIVKTATVNYDEPSVIDVVDNPTTKAQSRGQTSDTDSAVATAAQKPVVTVPMHATMIPTWSWVTAGDPSQTTVDLSIVQAYWSNLQYSDMWTFAYPLQDEEKRSKATALIDNYYAVAGKCLNQQSITSSYTQTEFDEVMAKVIACINSHVKMPMFVVTAESASYDEPSVVDIVETSTETQPTTGTTTTDTSNMVPTINEPTYTATQDYGSTGTTTDTTYSTNGIIAPTDSTTTTAWSQPVITDTSNILTVNGYPEGTAEDSELPTATSVPDTNQSPVLSDWNEGVGIVKTKLPLIKKIIKKPSPVINDWPYVGEFNPDFKYQTVDQGEQTGAPPASAAPEGIVSQDSQLPTVPIISESDVFNDFPVKTLSDYDSTLSDVVMPEYLASDAPLAPKVPEPDMTNDFPYEIPSGYDYGTVDQGTHTEALPDYSDRREPIEVGYELPPSEPLPDPSTVDVSDTGTTSDEAKLAEQLLVEPLTGGEDPASPPDWVQYGPDSETNTEVDVTTPSLRTHPEYPFSVTSRIVPPFWALDFDDSSAVLPNEWQMYVAKLRGLAMAEVDQSNDGWAWELLTSIVNYHYDTLQLCIDRLVDEAGELGQEEPNYNALAMKVQSYCYVKFRYSLYGGPAPFEWISKWQPTASSNDFIIWFVKHLDFAYMDRAQRRILPMSDEIVTAHQNLAVCALESLRTDPTVEFDRKGYYRLLVKSTQCAKTRA